MDAANLSFRRISFSVACALLMPAAAYAQPVFNVSPTSATLTGQSPTNVQVTSNSANIGYAASVNYPNAGDLNWLCVNPNGGPSTTPIAQNGSVTGLTTPDYLTLSVCGSPAINVTTHTATVTLNATDGSGAASVAIPVSYTLGSGGGGGAGAVVATPSSITETISAGSSVGPIQLTLTTSSATPISFTVGGTPSWITWYQQSGNSGFVSAGQPAVLYITLNGAGLNQATYSTSFTINAATGSFGVAITLNNGVAGGGGTTTSTGSLSVSPTTVSWSYATSNASAFPGPTTITMSSTNGAINYSATATSSNGWLLVNNAYVTGGTVGVTPLVLSATTPLAGLATGTYTGTVTITGSDGSTATVVVTASVTGASSGALTISPSPISIAAAVGGSVTPASVSVVSAVSGTLTATVIGTGACGSCFTVSGSSQSVVAGVAATVTVSANPAGLTNGTYIGTLTITVGSNSAGAQINFAVGTGGTSTGTSSVAPAQLNYYYEQNTSEPSSQTQQVYISGSGSFTVTSSTANSSPNWLTTSVSSGTLPATISVSASAAGLASGTYNGQITITNTSTSQVETVYVTLLVNGVSTIFASPGDNVFSYISGVSPTSQAVGIEILTSDGAIVAFTASVANASSTPWLTLSGQTSTSGSTPNYLTVIANATGLANGVYSGSIVVGGGNNSVTLPIVLVVTGSGTTTGTGSLTLGASAVSLSAQVNGGPVTSTLSVSAATSTAYTVSSSVSTGGTAWLVVSPSGSTTTSATPTLTITAYPAGLAAGTYSGSISLVANGVTQTVPVTLTVGGTATVAVTANGATSSPSLTFTALSLNATVASQYLSVASTAGESSVQFTAAASTTSGGNWLQLSTIAGADYSTPYTPITVAINTSGLAAGTYNGAITITPVGGTAVSVPVTLSITGAPVISVSTSSLSFAYQAGGATPATQTVPVTVSGASTGSYTASATSSTGWLVVSPTSGTAPASNLTVSLSQTALSALSAGTYNGTITVAGTSGATGSSTINVTLTITAPLPTITTVVNAASFVNEAISPGEIITIGGNSIGPATPASFTVSGNLVPSTLAGVQVLINGHAAPLLYVSNTQINCIVPYEIAGILNPTVLVEFLGQSSNGFVVNAAATAPGIFTANGSGSGSGAILNSDNSYNSAANPAARGSVIQVFMTGEGQTSPGGVDGKVTVVNSTPPYTPSPLVPIAITVAGLPATYQFAGEAPGLVSGVMQLNVVIPAASTLTTTGSVPLLVAIGSATSQGGVTVYIK